MGFIGSFLGKVAGEAALQGAEVAKQKLADIKAANEARNAEIQSMIGKKIKLYNYNISKWWDTNGNMSTDVSQNMRDRSWYIKEISSNNRYRLFHAPSQTTIFVAINEIV